MIKVVMSRAELKRALADLDDAVSRGFTDTLAVVELTQTGEFLHDDRMTYTDRVILRADDRDPSKNWGNMAARDIDCRYVDGQLKYDK